MILRIVAITLLLSSSAIALAKPDAATRRAPGPTITDAKWPDYEGMYGKSPHCSKAEITLWTCETKKTLYSICSSRRVTASSGYIQYRVSRAGRVVYLFPESRRAPLGHFVFRTGASGDASLDFSNKGYEYSLTDPLRGASSILVASKASPSNASEISCKNGNQTLQLNYTLKLMYDAGIWPGENKTVAPPLTPPSAAQPSSL